MSTATIPMPDRPKYGELDLFTQLAARVVEAENSARDDLRITNQEIRELRESIDSLRQRMDGFSETMCSFALRLGKAEVMAEDARDSANQAELLLDGLTSPAKAMSFPEPIVRPELVIEPDADPLDPNDCLAVAEFMEYEGFPGRRAMTPKGIARVVGTAADILGIERRKGKSGQLMVPVFFLRSFARFLRSAENTGSDRSAKFTRLAMAEDREGKLRAEG